MTTRTHFHTALVLALGLLAAACDPVPAVATQDDSWGPPALRDAHAAYLDGDLDRTVQAARAVLEDPSTPPVARDNVLALLDAAWATGNGKLPADWTVPASIPHLRVASVRKQKSDRVAFRFELGGKTTDPGALGQVRVVQAPDRVVLDRHAGLGTWDVSPEADGTYWFELEGPETAAPVPSGLYFVDLEVGGEDTRGWFVLTDHVATEAPPLHSPAEGETFATGQPTLRFDDFRSPQYRPWERRSMGTWVVRLQPDAATGKDYRVVWHRWVGKPGATTMTLGVGGDMPDTVLDDGDYWMALSFGERRKFGPLKIVRSTRTARPFQVRTSGR